MIRVISISSERNTSRSPSFGFRVNNMDVNYSLYDHHVQHELQYGVEASSLILGS